VQRIQGSQRAHAYMSIWSAMMRVQRQEH